MPTVIRQAHLHSHPNAGAQAGTKPKLYNPRHPERSLLYQTIAEHFETWLELASAGFSSSAGTPMGAAQAQVAAQGLNLPVHSRPGWYF